MFLVRGESRPRVHQPDLSHFPVRELMSGRNATRVVFSRNWYECLPFNNSSYAEFSDRENHSSLVYSWGCSSHCNHRRCRLVVRGARCTHRKYWTVGKEERHMNAALMLLLVLPTQSDMQVNAPRTNGPRVLAWQNGRVVQVWPNRAAPKVIRPNQNRPDARPFGPHPGDSPSIARQSITGQHPPKRAASDARSPNPRLSGSTAASKAMRRQPRTTRELMHQAPVHMPRYQPGIQTRTIRQDNFPVFHSPRGPGRTI